MRIEHQFLYSALRDAVRRERRNLPDAIADLREIAGGQSTSWPKPRAGQSPHQPPDPGDTRIEGFA